MEDVLRYELSQPYEDQWGYQHKAHMCIDPEGQYVEYGDHAALAERLKRAEDPIEHADYFAPQIDALAERLNQAECNQELVELYWQREQKAIKERDELKAEVQRLKRVMEDAASAPGIDWLFWQIELGKALKEAR